MNNVSKYIKATKVWEEYTDDSEFLKILKNRHTCGNFTDKEVSKYDKNQILQSIYVSPDKTNTKPYIALAVGQSEVGKKLKNLLYNEITFDSDTLTGVEYAPFSKNNKAEMSKNPQVLAPLVIMYFARNVADDINALEKVKEEVINPNQVENQIKEIKEDSKDPNYHYSAIYIAAMTSMLSAESLGYKTAYCGCIFQKKSYLLEKFFKDHLIEIDSTFPDKYSDNKHLPVVMVCIGHSVSNDVTDRNNWPMAGREGARPSYDTFIKEI